MMTRAVFLASLVLAGAAPAADLPAPCVSALRRALASQASWTMERRLPGSGRALVSTGVVACVVGQGITWSVRHPFPSSISMTTNTMVFADEDGRRVKPLDDLPYYGEIRARTDAFARGDLRAFDGLFDMKARLLPGGRWNAVFTPALRPLRRLFTEMEFSGAATLETAVLKTAQGGTSTIRFRERAHVR
jgi:hypothetical protein